MIARLQELISRVNAFLHHRTLDRDFQEELESHLAMLVADYVGRGMSPEEIKMVLDAGTDRSRKHGRCSPADHSMTTV